MNCTLKTSKKLKKKTKRAYLLIEALVSIALLFIAGFSFFSFGNRITNHTQARNLKIEAERIEGLALAELIESLYKNTIPWDDLQRNWPETRQIKDEPDWQVTYSFTLSEKDEKEPTGYLVEVKMALTYNPTRKRDLQEIIVPPKSYTFCVDKK